MPIFKDLADGFAHLLFPQLCEGCRTPLMQQEQVLCLACRQELSYTGFHAIPDNEAATRFAGRIPYQHVTALSYLPPDSLILHLMHRLKYNNKQGIGIFIGQQLGNELLKSDWLQIIDVIVPVPLHPKKEATRTYNQSALIAIGIGEATGKPTALKALRRTRHTDSQTLKSREERFFNVKDAFIATDESLKGRHVLLIDDVLTTGATLEAAAAALLSVPGTKVSIATVGLAAG